MERQIMLLQRRDFPLHIFVLVKSPEKSVKVNIAI